MNRLWKNNHKNKSKVINRSRIMSEISLLILQLKIYLKVFYFNINFILKIKPTQLMKKTIVNHIFYKDQFQQYNTYIKQKRLLKIISLINLRKKPKRVMSQDKYLKKPKVIICKYRTTKV
jgi:hypothetical protein